jgi:hypothetical protein
MSNGAKPQLALRCLERMPSRHTEQRAKLASSHFERGLALTR